jgi:hypothetical protein
MTTTSINNQESVPVPNWVRRGHTRKPNKVVCALYLLFDLIADFGPMFASFFRWIGRTAVGTWTVLADFMMRVVNLGILVGIIYVSTGHSYSLLVDSGMNGIAAWVFVGVWESVFVSCSMVIEKAYRQGRKSSIAAWIGFMMGFVFVEFSNYMGMANNPIAKAIGLSTPLLLLVMKRVLAYQFRKDIPKKKNFWLVSFFNRIGESIRAFKEMISASKSSSTKAESSSTIELSGENKSPAPLSVGGISTSQSVTSSSELPGEKTPIPPRETTSRQIASNENSSVKIATSTTSDKVTSGNITSSATSKKKITSKGSSTTGKKKTTSRKNTNASEKVVSMKDRDAEIARIIEVAKKIVRTEGRANCGRGRLMKEADCRENHAKCALEKIDQLIKEGLLEDGLSPAGENKSPASPEQAGENKSPAPAPTGGEETSPVNDQKTPASATGEKTPPTTSDEISPVDDVKSPASPEQAGEESAVTSQEEISPEKDSPEEENTSAPVATQS